MLDLIRSLAISSPQDLKGSLAEILEAITALSNSGAVIPEIIDIPYSQLYSREQFGPLICDEAGDVAATLHDIEQRLEQQMKENSSDEWKGDETAQTLILTRKVIRKLVSTETSFIPVKSHADELQYCQSAGAIVEELANLRIQFRHRRG